MIACALLLAVTVPADSAAKPGAGEVGIVRCANLIYGNNKTSVCFSDAFLKQVNKDTHIQTRPRFEAVKLETDKLYDYPFAVMTGEGSFKLTAAQRKSMRQYLTRGGFMIASAGCSSKKWNKSFRSEIKKVFPEVDLTRLKADHPIFHTVNDVTTSRFKSGKSKLPQLEGLQIDGKTVLIWSPDGLNDTANAGGNCCCCGGNEIKSAKKLNANILAYALTH